jgi:hypothetical protein
MSPRDVRLAAGYLERSLMGTDPDIQKLGELLDDADVARLRHAR